MQGRPVRRAAVDARQRSWRHLASLSLLSVTKRKRKNVLESGVSLPDSGSLGFSRSFSDFAKLLSACFSLSQHLLMSEYHRSVIIDLLLSIF